MSDVRTERVGDVMVVTMSRPPANYFDRELIADVVKAVGQGAREGARSAVLASEGKHFCAGANFAGETSIPDRVANSQLLYRSAAALFRAPIPIVAAVQGAAVGGGLGLACAADFRIATGESRFHANFSRLGFHPGFGLSVSLPRIVGSQFAAEMFYTSRTVRGEEAAARGLVDRLSEPADLLDSAMGFAHEIAASAPLAVQSISRTLRAQLADEVEAVLERELQEQERLWATKDCAEGIRASLARETPNFAGR